MVVYWGARLPADENLQQMAENTLLDVTGGMMDATAPLSLCPAVRDTFHGHPGMELRQNNKPIYPKFKLKEAQEEGCKQNQQTLRFFCHCELYQLELELCFKSEQGGIITATSALNVPNDIDVLWLAAPVLPAPQHAQELFDFSGRWIGEFRLQKTPWRAGQHVREARLGRSGHEHPPFVLLPLCGTTNTAGDVYAMHFGWSGGHKMLAEELPDGRRQVQWGKLPNTIYPCAQTSAGQQKRYTSAPLYISFSQNGLNGTAKTFQRFLRDQSAATRSMPRKVHYNCWEAIYFDHNLDDLCAIADHAAQLGAERFVLDDGWFGRRDDDTSSLGDWDIDVRKWPDGLTPLINHVQALGMDFGLWFEPEMISKNSALYRAHPDWVLGPADQTTGRQQYVLDMRKTAVQAYLFDKIDAILQAHDISYIKWDHNRLPPLTDSRQCDGLYALLERITQAHPKLELESCASGGGRIDAGILRYMGRVWLSDSNDALERLRIQHEAALFLPALITGSHVGPAICHTSGRILDIEIRAWVAAQRHMGFEMDLRAISATEQAVLSHVTKWYKKNRDWLAQADILRLDHTDPSIIAEMQVAHDASRFVVFAGKSASSVQISPRPLRLTGLDADAVYEVTLINRGDAPALSRGVVALKNRSITASGAWLMGQGLTLPWAFPATIWVLEGHLKKASNGPLAH